MIDNEKRRLSKEDINKMVSDAEKYADDDKIVTEKINSKNSLETYLFYLKSTISDSKTIDDDSKTIDNLIKDCDDWMTSEKHSKEDYDNKKKELENICNPILLKKNSPESSKVVEDVD